MLRIREAGVEDVPLILSFTRELAEYEREPNAVRATEDDSRRDGFSANPKFRVIIAESDGQPSRNSLLFPELFNVAGEAWPLLRRSLCPAAFPGQRHRQGPHGSSSTNRHRRELLRDAMGSARLEYVRHRRLSAIRGSFPRALASHADYRRRSETPS